MCSVISRTAEGTGRGILICKGEALETLVSIHSPACILVDKSSGQGVIYSLPGFRQSGSGGGGGVVLRLQSLSECRLHPEALPHPAGLGCGQGFCISSKSQGRQLVLEVC